MTNPTLNLVEAAFSWLKSTYDCTITRADERCIEIGTRNVLLRLRHGGSDLPTLHLVPRGQAEEIDLFELLFRERASLVSHCAVQAPATATVAQREAIMIGVLACALRSAGQDILIGGAPGANSHGA